MEQQFPIFWYCKVTQESQKLLSKFRKFNDPDKLVGIGGYVGFISWFMHPNGSAEHLNPGEPMDCDFKNEITFEEFKKYVINK